MWAVPENGRCHDHAIIPGGYIDVVYEQAGSQVRCLVFGTTSRMRFVRISPDATSVGTRFRPGMARHLLDDSLEELRDPHLEVQGFLGLTPEQVADAPTFSA